MEAAAIALAIMLTMTERSGHDRINEPVRIGVPLAKGAVSTVEKMTLLDEQGNPIPCQFTPVCRWPGDGSIKWVHMDFITSIQANAVRKLKLELQRGSTPAPNEPLLVQEKGDRVTVATGKLKVCLKGKKFNFIDSVWYDDNEIIPSQDRGIALVTEAGNFYPVNDDGTITVESSGPLRAVVKCEGAFKDRNGRKAFDYCVRFYFYAGLPRVNVAFTYINRIGEKAADHQQMRDLSILIPTSIGKELTGTIGTETTPLTTKLRADEALGIFQDSSDSYRVVKGPTSLPQTACFWDSELLASGRGKSAKPLTTGWGALRWSDTGIAAGWRWFWQMFPSTIKLQGDGTIRLGLYPAEAGKPLSVYMGQARTHYLTFIFGPDSPEQLNDVYAGVQRPLRAFPEPKYLCRDSEAFGKIAESNPELFGKLWPRLQNYDKVLRRFMDNHLARIDGAIYKDRWWIEGYGYRPWGDAVLWLHDDASYPWNVCWSGNYYDFAFACLEQFMRTGEFDYLDQFELHGMREADVFTVNYHPVSYLIGACRYCPPRNHIGIESRGPYVSREFNHHKAQSTFALWYLLGDERMREVALLKLNNAYHNHDADNGWKQIRGPGAQLATLYMGYELTGDAKYLERMKEMLEWAHRRLGDGADSFGHARGKFMYGIGLEGVIYEYWLTGDRPSLEFVKTLTDYLIESGQVLKVTSNIAFALAYLYHETGDEKYKELALQVLEKLKPRSTGEVKTFGMYFRSTPQALYYLSVPARLVK